jgi:NTE family protein
VLSTGPLSRAIDAATAVPTIFPPVAVGAKRLVDGWMVNPLPADVAIAEGATRIIAIDPSAAERGAGIGANGRRPRGILARIAKTFDVGARVRVAMRAMDVSARDRALAAKSLIDVCIEPPLARYASTAIGDYDRIVEIGDKAATEAVPRIRELLRQEAFA